MRFLLTILLALNGFIAAAQTNNFSSFYKSGSTLYVHSTKGLSMRDIKESSLNGELTSISIKKREIFITFSFDWQINDLLHS